MSISARKRLGFIVPSSNTVLEPVTSKFCESVPGLSVHYARIRVTGISLSETELRQFDEEKFVAAADLLADAETDLVVWNGTSGSWLGFDYDRKVCDTVERATGVKALTTSLAYLDMLKREGISRVALVTPYIRAVQDQIAVIWGAEGIECVAERHLGIERNFSFGEVTEETVDEMIRSVGDSGCEAVVILCTNVLGAWVAPGAEAVLGVPVLDSVSVTLRGALDKLGLDAAPLARWGRVFDPATPLGPADARDRALPGGVEA